MLNNGSKRPIDQGDGAFLFITSNSSSSSQDTPSKADIHRHVQRRGPRKKSAPPQAPLPVIIAHRPHDSAHVTQTKSPKMVLSIALASFDPFDSLATNQPVHIKDVLDGLFLRPQQAQVIHQVSTSELEERAMFWQMAMADTAWYHTLAANMSLLNIVKTSEVQSRRLQHKALALNAMQEALRRKVERSDALLMTVAFQLDDAIDGSDPVAASYHARALQMLSAITPIEHLYYGYWETLVFMAMKYAMWASVTPPIRYAAHPACALNSFEPAFERAASYRASRISASLPALQHYSLDSITLFGLLRRLFIQHMLGRNPPNLRQGRGVHLGLQHDLCMYSALVGSLPAQHHEPRLQVLYCLLLTATLTSWAMLCPWRRREAFCDGSYTEKNIGAVLDQLTGITSRHSPTDFVETWRKTTGLECLVWITFTICAWLTREGRSTDHESRILEITLSALRIDTMLGFLDVLQSYPLDPSWVESSSELIWHDCMAAASVSSDHDGGSPTVK